jgi:hypothetical protein
VPALLAEPLGTAKLLGKTDNFRACGEQGIRGLSAGGENASRYQTSTPAQDGCGARQVGFG